MSKLFGILSMPAPKFIMKIVMAFFSMLLCVVLFFNTPLCAQPQNESMLSDNLDLSKYSSIQAAIDANPGKVINLPSATYTISTALKLTTNGSGLNGFAKIIQENPNEPIIDIANAKYVKLSGLTLVRKISDIPVNADGIRAQGCVGLSLENVRVFDNKSSGAGIRLNNCIDASIANCRVENYMCISIDDRTGSMDWGYAFNCIDGTGITVSESIDVLIINNSVVEYDLRPTREVKEKYKLGDFVKMNQTKGELVSQKTWDEKWVSNWHQGSAILVTSPYKTSRIQLVANRIRNAAQGIDIHADNVIVSQNIVENSFMGLKAMHGSRCVIISSNQFIKNDLWAIGVMPGAASFGASKGKPSNDDGSTIISNNIISQLGEGDSAWIWNGGGRAIFVDLGQKDENPPIRDVIISGNIMYCSDENNPKFAYSLLIKKGTKASKTPQNIKVSSDNIFKKGSKETKRND